MPLQTLCDAFAIIATGSVANLSFERTYTSAYEITLVLTPAEYPWNIIFARRQTGRYVLGRLLKHTFRRYALLPRQRHEAMVNMIHDVCSYYEKVNGPPIRDVARREREREAVRAIVRAYLRHYYKPTGTFVRRSSLMWRAVKGSD